MASLAYSLSPSPNSFQLRFGLRSKRSSVSVLRMNCRLLNCSRIRASSAAGRTARDGSHGNGNGIFQGNSWMTSEDSANSYSGWIDRENNESQGMGKFGGIIGAVLAGGLLATGVAFASLSLKQRKHSGHELQMEPLAKQQAELSASEELKENADELENKDERVPLDEGQVQNVYIGESKTGISQEPYPVSKTSDEATIEGNPDDKINMDTLLVDDVESASNIDSKPFTSNQGDQQHDQNVDISLSIGSSITSTTLLEPDVNEFPGHSLSVGLSRPNVLELSDSHTSDSDMSNSLNELKNSVDGTEPVHVLVSDSINPRINYEEEILDCEDVELPLTSSDSPLDSDHQLHNHSLPLDSSIASESEAKSASFGMSKDMMKITSDSSVQESSQMVSVQVSDKDIDSTPKECNPPVNLSLGSTIHVMSDDDSQKHEQNLIGDSKNDNRKSFFESAKPQKSFSHAGIPAPSLVSAALQVPPGKVVVPPVVDSVQGQALAALQVLKVIDADAQPSDLCTRREYARWLVCASSVLSRNTMSKVYPAMYIENVTELAFDDVTPEDPDFPYIQGLAEAGLISSALSRNDVNHFIDGDQGPVFFAPGSPLSRQDLVSWKIAVEKKHLPDTDKRRLYECTGFLDIDKINPDAWPALVADISAGENGITALAFGYTRLFQPEKPVTKAQAAIALATGESADIVGEELARIEAEAMAETAVAAHTALVAQVEKDINANFERELAMEREKIDTMEKLAEEARQDLLRLKTEREEEKNALLRGKAAIESEMEILSKLRREVEEQLETVLYNKAEILFERDRINKLRKEAESENQVIEKLQQELEIERKALSMARAWAEDEARRAREQAKVLQEARDQWERQGLKVVVEGDLRDDTAEMVWTHTVDRTRITETVNGNKMITRAESLVDELKAMAGEMKLRSSVVVEKLIEKIAVAIATFGQKAAETARKADEIRSVVVSKATSSLNELHQNTSSFSSTIANGAKRVAGDCRDGMAKITQKFKA